jgi:endo-1,4-beta-xylanase
MSGFEEKPEAPPQARRGIHRQEANEEVSMFLAKKIHFCGSVPVLIAALLFFAGCQNPAGEPEQPDFVPVTDITGVPSTGTAGSPVSLANAAAVPNTATNRSIAWTVKAAGAGVSAISGNSFTPTTGGSLVLTAAIAGGSAESAPYSKDFTIAISPSDVFVPVTDITGVPDSGFVGDEIDLTVANVVPNNADNKAIVWTVKNAGTTGVSSADVADGKFTPAATGALTLLATIAGGNSPDTDYVQEFTLVIFAVDEFVPVTNITGVPDRGMAERPVDISGATVVPGIATNKDISWVVKDAGGTGVTNAMVAAGVSFIPTAAGTLVLTARILSGQEEGVPYVQDFTIEIDPPFTPVSDINGMPETRNAVTGAQIDLNIGLSVAPAGATNTDIEWSVKSAGDTGLTTADVTGGIFVPSARGTVTLTATILDGKAQGENFTKDTTIVIIKPVTGISGVPVRGTRGQATSLAGVTVTPGDATNRTIVWSVKSGGTTGVAAVAVNSFTPSGTGILVLTATIANGSAIGTDFANDYTIRIDEPGAVPPDFGLGDDTSIVLKDKDGTTLSADSVVRIDRNAVYYVALEGAYTDVAWYLNGVKQADQGALIYLDTSTARTIKVVVEGKKDGVFESSAVYTFAING